MKVTPQAIAGGLTLTLANPEEITKVVGTQYTNTIYGNLLADTLDSAALPDPTLSGATPSSPRPRTSPLAYLDFSSYADPVAGQPAHVYTLAEQQTILQAIEADYFGPNPASPWFNVQFTTTKPNLPARLLRHPLLQPDPARRASRGASPARSTSATSTPAATPSIQVNGLLGGQGQPAATRRPISTPSRPRSPPTSSPTCSASATPTPSGRSASASTRPPDSSAFNPTSSDPDAAFETFDHIISSPATQGTDRFNDLRPARLRPSRGDQDRLRRAGDHHPDHRRQPSDLDRHVLPARPAGGAQHRRHPA